MIGDVIKNGGFGSYVTELINNTGTGAPVTVLGLPDKGIEHGKRELIYKKYGLDAEGIKKCVMGT